MFFGLQIYVNFYGGFVDPLHIRNLLIFVFLQKEENEKRRDQGMRLLPPYTPEDLDRHVDRPVPASHFNRLVISSQLDSHAKQTQLLAETGLNKIVLIEKLNS